MSLLRSKEIASHKKRSRHRDRYCPGADDEISAAEAAHPAPGRPPAGRKQSARKHAARAGSFLPSTSCFSQAAELLRDSNIAAIAASLSRIKTQNSPLMGEI